MGIKHVSIYARCAVLGIAALLVLSMVGLRVSVAGENTQPYLTPEMLKAEDPPKPAPAGLFASVFRVNESELGFVCSFAK